MAVVLLRTHNMSSGQSQLTRSLERILEEANFSGELKLSNRKLKEFPKSATKYNLSDTVIADLSRNRFCELPEDVTSFAFLERLLLYHNTIRVIPQSVKGLSSLTYLDLRSNQLNSLPREICFLPLEVLLVANNRLVALPDELGRMENLTDLDASCNQLANLPMRIGDLRNLRSLSLRSNQLMYLPREITYLTLIYLNLSCNKIASLPMEIRHMTTLVELHLENNPLSSPPASLCVRGLVHVFKYLETQAVKEDKVKSGGNYDGITTLRRTARNTNSLMENTKSTRHNVDSGYSTSDGIGKRWSQDAIKNASVKSTVSMPKSSMLLDYSALESNIPNSILLSCKNGGNETMEQNILNDTSDMEKDKNYSTTNNSVSTSPEDDYITESQKDVRNKNFGNIQTYREYKEALKQQRNHVTSSVYRSNGQKTSPEASNILFNIGSIDDAENIGTNNCINRQTKNNGIDQQSSLALRNGGLIDECAPVTKKPIQKVNPSRNPTLIQAPEDSKLIECSRYVKPNSPTRSSEPVTNNNSSGVKAFVTKPSNLKIPSTKHRNVSWNNDITPEKLSFTMRREFDKQKEETELITQLRTIIETRLKMNLPEDIASALTDGVILCHLANYVRPRSVASIHVPSPGVPKLTMARCRRNVDNFLEACRKIGVDEELICSCADVVSNEQFIDEGVPNPSAVYRTVEGLLNVHREQQQQKDSSIPATNANRTDEQGNDVSLNSIATTKCINSLISKTKSKYCIQDNENGNTIGELINIYKNSVELNQTPLNEMNESFFTHQYTAKDFFLNKIECKNADKLNCEINGFESISYINVIEGKKNNKYEMISANDLNSPDHRTFDFLQHEANINVNSKNNIPPKTVTKFIDFFESGPAEYNKEKMRNPIQEKMSKFELENGEENSVSRDSAILSIILSCTFIITFLMLIIFPLPN